MKKIFMFLAIFSITVFANSSTWLHDYDDAVAKSQKTHKPIILMLSAKD